LGIGELADVLGVCESTIDKWQVRGRKPSGDYVEMVLELIPSANSHNQSAEISRAALPSMSLASENLFLRRAG